MGKYLADKGVKRVYLLAPNYPAGRDMLAGFKRFYKGEIVNEVYTQFGQLDYAAEIAQVRAAKPDGTFIFYPGGMGINFVKQYAQAGLVKEVPLYGPSFSIDQTILPAVGDAALGLWVSTFYSEKLKTPGNDKFVADFEADYKRIPSPYAAQGYDGAVIVDKALQAVDGKIEDKEAFRKALENVKFDSIRGPFRFNKNHFPIQDYYITEIVKDEKGRPVMEPRGTVLKDHGDAYVGECKMPGS
jgi:branched-chain amino acid transport system substrate-binding protein